MCSLLTRGWRTITSAAGSGRSSGVDGRSKPIETIPGRTFLLPLALAHLGRLEESYTSAKGRYRDQSVLHRVPRSRQLDCSKRRPDVFGATRSDFRRHAEGRNPPIMTASRRPVAIMAGVVAVPDRPAMEGRRRGQQAAAERLSAAAVALGRQRTCCGFELRPPPLRGDEMSASLCSRAAEKWRARQDSNLWPLPSEGNALSS